MNAEKRNKNNFFLKEYQNVKHIYESNILTDWSSIEHLQFSSKMSHYLSTFKFFIQIQKNT